MGTTAPATTAAIDDGVEGALRRAIEQAARPEALVDAAWLILSRVKALATDPRRYRLEFLREGCETGDLNLVEIGLNRFFDVDPGQDDDED